MANIRAQRDAFRQGKKWLVATCVCTLWICGCYTKRPAAKPVVTYVAPVKPVIPAAMRAKLEIPPEISMEPLPEAPEILPVRAQPAKPRVAAPTKEPVEVEKQAEPAIVPEVPSEELKAAQAETQHNLDLAEKNLALAQGKSLNPAQMDVVSKVKGYAESARDAMKSGDWVKAKNLSNKAELLSEQLASSF
ncbi:MAG TPA: hypothetical protein VMH89_01775 [Candidatus Acidoferrum sp.]|nr:hypothetical protein [Candidatus Acidoferrum sp.]